MLASAGPPLSYGAAVAYGLIQGVTEFLPVSSSGHLKLAHRMGLGQLPTQLELPFDVLLHAATLVAIAVAFRSDIAAAIRLLVGRSTMPKERTRFALVMAIAVVPTGLVGLGASPLVAWFGRSFLAIGCCYLITAAFLWVAHRKGKGGDAGADAASSPKARNPQELLAGIRPRQAAWVGCLQIFALLPGVSRSGSTVAAGLVAGMGRRLSVSFSFLVGLPLIFAAAAKDALDGGFGRLLDAAGAGPLVAAFGAAVLAGWLAIWALKFVVAKRALHWFSGYCVLVAIACFAAAIA